MVPTMKFDPAQFLDSLNYKFGVVSGKIYIIFGKFNVFLEVLGGV